ncbi:MAG: hypothetical protein HQK84_04580 [Nitrospinae bacterium]|nr:hypothetical protein [Nitrospinota bacterium]
MKLLLLSTLLLLVSSCSDQADNPLLELQRIYKDKPSYIIVLEDMKEEGNFFTEYFQKYKVAAGEDVAITNWAPVSEEFYKKYENFLGMTIWGKDKNGNAITTSAPPVYQYVGDEKYGQWKQDSSGNSFWEFYGKYAMLMNVMNFAGNMIYMNNYRNYTNSIASGRPYYGAQRQYGTAGSFTKRSKPNFFKRRQMRMSKSGFSNKFARASSLGRSKSSGFRSRSFGFGK